MTIQGTSFSIPAILEINEGVIHHLESLLKKYNFHNTIIYFDDFTYENYAKAIQGTFSSLNIDTKALPLKMDIHTLIDEAFCIKNYDAVLAMGGGAIIDYGKYIAFSRKLPFISIPTSASNDGFASSNCSIQINQKKTTVPAKIPYGIVVDLDIVQTAPNQLILAGIGDLMSNITALYDWDFEERHGVGQVNAFAAMLSKKAVNSFIRTPMNDIKNPIFLKELISSMTIGGISTDISGNSAPISGSEHLISHALDKISVNPQMHGVQVGIATYIMAKVQDHRYERIIKVFERTGFFNYVKTLPLNKEEYRQAIDLAPSIKPSRYTYLHEEAYREKAKKLLDEDRILCEIFHKI
ncbi:iron-containing alcohol dehydrogenase family protein [Bacillus sp. 03113]|uniref:iron-containing alcohol dehydrogenase family protein n=1 Tax=Bacillus sp. 03113 TaxID=2578211 RepID=UPI001144D8DD|nr:iron-containing alcohol dehydrogenase family protein [Bacillus sp. 03113]